MKTSFFGLAACLHLPLAAQVLHWDTNAATSGAQGSTTSPAVWDYVEQNWWNGTVNVPWSGTANAAFGGTPGVVQIPPNLTSNLIANDLTFLTGGFTVPASSFSGAYEIRGSINAGRPLYLNATLSNTDLPDITVASGVRAILSFTTSNSGVRGSVGFTKRDSGTLYLQPNTTTATSLLTGEVTVNAGTLVFDSLSPSSLDSSNPYPNLATTSGGPIVVQLGGTLHIDRSHALGGTTAEKYLRIESSGALTFGNARQTLSGITLQNAGVLTTTRHTTTAAADETDASAILTPATGTTITTTITGNYTSAIRPNIEILNGPLTFNINDATSLIELSIPGIIHAPTGSTAVVTKTGPGTLRFESANDFPGHLAVNQGILISAAADSLGAATTSGNGEVRITGTGSIDLSGTAHTRNKSWFIAGHGPDGQGAIRNSGAAVDANSRIVNLTLTGDASIGGSGNYHIGWNPTLPLPTSGTINGGGFKLTKRGSSEVRVRATSSNIHYEVEAGTLTATTSLAFGSNPIKVLGGALRASTNVTIANAIDIPGPGTLGSVTSTASFTGPITLSPGNLSIDTPAGTTLTFTGGITGTKGGPGPTFKTGPGTAVINCPAPAPTVIAGTLRGTGTLNGSFDVEAPATLAPGNPTGTFTVNGDIILFGKITFNINNAQSAKLTVNGIFGINSAAELELPAGNSYNQPSYILVEYTTLSGSFTKLPTPPPGYSFDMNYQGQNRIALVAGVADPFQTWIAAKGLTGNNALPTADPDGDKLPNLIEFILDTQPNPALGGGTGAGNRFVIENTSSTHFTVRHARRADSTYLNSFIRHGANLANPNSWTTAVHNVSGVTISVTSNHFGPGIDRVSVLIPKAARTTAFAQLAVPN